MAPCLIHDEAAALADTSALKMNVPEEGKQLFLLDYTPASIIY